MKQKPVEIRDLLSFRYPENLQYSPDGTWLAFQCAQAVEDKDTYHRDVWIAKDGAAKQLTATLSTSIVLWDDDSHLIVTRQVPDSTPGITELYKIDVTGGEAQKWIELPFALSQMKKVHDGLYAVTASIDKNDPDAYKDSAETRKKKSEGRKKEADYQVVDEVPFWFNGAGFVNGQRTALFMVETGETIRIRRITAPLFDVSEFIVQDDTVYYAGNTKDRRMSLYTRVYAYHTDTKKKETLYGKNTHSIGGLMILNGQLYAQASDMKEYGVNETANICVIHDGRIDPAAWKQALTGTAPSLSRIVRAGETAAQELQSRGICFDGDPRSMCWTLVEPQEGHPILTPVFVLCDLLIAAETPEDASSMTAIQLAKPASASEDFYSSAADEAVEQWNDLKYCPYCFGRDLRMTMSGRRRCKACRAVIKPFEIYRPQ